MSAPLPRKFDLDLGDGHWLQWFTDQTGTVVGCLIWHTWPPGHAAYVRPGRWTDLCCCSSHFAGYAHPGEHVWQVSGGLGEHITLSPSILCGCGDHGFVNNGKWEKV